MEATPQELEMYLEFGVGTNTKYVLKPILAAASRRAKRQGRVGPRQAKQQALLKIAGYYSDCHKIFDSDASTVIIPARFVQLNICKYATVLKCVSKRSTRRCRRIL